MKPVRKTLSLPDIQLSYLEWNQSQEPLLLLHGAGGDALVWSSLAVTLANRYHIVALDMRGHGESSKPQGNYPYSDADLIADLEAVMVRLGWSSAHVVGHSWMGNIGSHLGTATSRAFAEYDSGRSGRFCASALSN